MTFLGITYSAGGGSFFIYQACTKSKRVKSNRADFGKDFVFKTNTIFFGEQDIRLKIDNGNRPATTSVLNIVPPFGDNIKDVLIEELLMHNKDTQVLICSGLKFCPGQHQGETIGHGERNYDALPIFWE